MVMFADSRFCEQTNGICEKVPMREHSNLKATKYFYSVALFIMLYKVDLTE